MSSVVNPDVAALVDIPTMRNEPEEIYVLLGMITSRSNSHLQLLTHPGHDSLPQTLTIHPREQQHNSTNPLRNARNTEMHSKYKSRCVLYTIL